MELVDIGVNLTGKSFKDDGMQVVDEAVTAGVTKIVITGTTESHSKQAALLSQSRPGVLFATAGIHPHHASDLNVNSMQTLAELAELEQVVAIGECGLDWYRNLAPRDTQIAAFTERRRSSLFYGYCNRIVRVPGAGYAYWYYGLDM